MADLFLPSTFISPSPLCVSVLVRVLFVCLLLHFHPTLTLNWLCFHVRDHLLQIGKADQTEVGCEQIRRWNVRIVILNRPMQVNPVQSWILVSELWILVSRSWIPVFVSRTQILDSNRQWTSGFLELYYENTGFRMP